MNDNKKNKQKNQSIETIIINNDQEKHSLLSDDVPDATPEENLVPEELPPDISSPEDSINRDNNLNKELPQIFQENKKQPLLIIAIVIIFLIFFIFIFRLIFSGKKTSQQVILNYWGLWEEKEIFEPLIANYQKKYPYVKINYQKMESQNYREKLLVRSRNNQGPDIFRFHNTWLPQIKEITSPIPNSIMSNDEFEKTFYKIHQKDLKVGDKYYGFPLSIDGLVLVYNVNLFKKAGIDKPPETWDELSNLVPKLTVKDIDGNIITAGIALGLAVNVEHFSDILALMIYQNGGNIKELNSEEAAGALESYRKFSELPNRYWDENMPNSLTAFIQEKVAMIFVPSWQILSIKSANPEIEVKAVPVPSLPGASPVSIANYWIEGVSKMSQNQIEAWRFLRFLVEKDSLTQMYELASRTRLFGEPYSRVDLAPLLIQNNYLGAVIKQADYFVSAPAIYRTFDNGLNDEIIKYLENAINATIEGVSYNEALMTAKKGVDQVFEKYKL